MGAGKNYTSGKHGRKYGIAAAGREEKYETLRQQDIGDREAGYEGVCAGGYRDRKSVV